MTGTDPRTHAALVAAALSSLAHRVEDYGANRVLGDEPRAEILRLAAGARWHLRYDLRVHQIGLMIQRRIGLRDVRILPTQSTVRWMDLILAEHPSSLLRTELDRLVAAPLQVAHAR